MRAAVAVFLLVALALPAMAKQAAPTWEAAVTPEEVDTTLYFHAVDASDMPINTQEPLYPARAGSGAGVAAATLTCLHPTTGPVTQGTTSQDMHTYYGFSSPSFVEYDAPAGGIRFWPERGFGYEIPLNGSTPAVLHWFMTESSGTSEGPRAPLANVVVRVAMREPVPVSIDDKGYGTGRTILEGATAPVTAFGGQIVGDGAAQVSASQANGRWVYDFAVPLAMQVHSLNRSAGFNVRIDVFTDNPACQDQDSVMVSTAEGFADAQHQPRIEVRNGKPLEVSDVGVLEAGNGTFQLRWDVLSGWGNYDVAVPEAAVEVFGPDGALEVRLERAVHRYHEYYHFMEPYEGTWAVTDLSDGTYTALFTVPNLQHTATADARVTFHVHEGRLVDELPQEAPAVEVALLFVGLALAVAWRRRT